MCNRLRLDSEGSQSKSNIMVSAVIVAAGKGTRMGVHVDKLFLTVAGEPIIAHTWRRYDLTPCIGEIVLVVRPDHADAFRELAVRHGFKKPFRLAEGGKERQDSVWNGLMAVSPQCQIVAIQDGARPCTPQQVIEASVQVAREYGAAVAASKVTDTIKESMDGCRVDRTPDRSRLWAVQTPQTFRLEVIKNALGRVREQGLLVTDDTAACELIGQAVRLVECKAPNPKATSPADLPYIELLLNTMPH